MWDKGMPVVRFDLEQQQQKGGGGVNQSVIS